MSIWIREPLEAGWYWYIDVDFMQPERVSVTIEGDTTTVAIDDDCDLHSLEDLRDDGAHFYGPIPEIAPPEVPSEIRDYLEDLDKIRWGDDAFQDLDDDDYISLEDDDDEWNEDDED